jgi:hypothetical protein
MRDFAGFDDWIPIFVGGTQTDSRGIEHDGDALIDKAIETYDPELHEAPLTVGHPKNNAPAFGWVTALKKIPKRIQKGKDKVNVLLARFKQVPAEFEAAVKEGLFKKRSASFYPDGRLRHVGFLGAAPPAVKGLSDLKFDDGDEAILFTDIESVDFSLSPFVLERIGDIFSYLREWFIEKDGREEADRVLPRWDIDRIKDESKRLDDERTKQGEDVNMGYSDKGYTEEAVQSLLDKQKAEFSEELDAKVKTAKEAARKEAEREFAEKRRGDEIKDFCDKGIRAGSEVRKIPPAWIKMGLAEFMERLSNDEPVEFSEDKKSTPYEWFCDFLAELPKVVEFGEIATRDKDLGTKGAGEKLIALIRKKMAENKELKYGAAFAEVQSENPEIAQEYQQELLNLA